MTGPRRADARRPCGLGPAPAQQAAAPPLDADVLELATLHARAAGMSLEAALRRPVDGVADRGFGADGTPKRSP
jgi:hypothetical protein